MGTTVATIEGRSQKKNCPLQHPLNIYYAVFKNVIKFFIHNFSRMLNHTTTLLIPTSFSLPIAGMKHHDENYSLHGLHAFIN